MKATIIISTLILFTALMGCSDNLNITEPLHYASGQPNNSDVPRIEILWELQELTANTNFSISGQCENSAVYNNPPFTMISSYQVSFDVYTNADKFTNGYRPLVQVFRNDEAVFESSAYPSESGELVSHVKIDLNNVRIDELKMYIALFQADTRPVNEDSSVILSLSKIILIKLN